MSIDFKKVGGLAPVIIQDVYTLQVLMLGYMNEEAYAKTVQSSVVTFYSRSKKRLWTKGETSGNMLRVEKITLDCDKDCILILAKPAGPTCHKGTTSCFNIEQSKGFLYKLQATIHQKISSKEKESYTSTLYEKGINKVAQKVGEEAIETVIASKDEDLPAFRNEVADLLYHLLVLLKSRNTTLEEIEGILKLRSKLKNLNS